MAERGAFANTFALHPLPDGSRKVLRPDGIIPYVLVFFNLKNLWNIEKPPGADNCGCARRFSESEGNKMKWRKNKSEPVSIDEPVRIAALMPLGS